MRRVTHPVQGFLAALAAVAVLSVMDAVMKHLVLAIGLFAVSVWRAAVNLFFSSALYLPRRREWPSRKTLWIHIIRGVDVTVMAALFFWGIARVPLAQALKLPYAAIAWQQDAAAESSIGASYGHRKASERCMHIPLIYQQEVVGELLLASRSPGESLDEADQ